MRIVIYPNALGLGGSQLNAVDLAERMHARGHDVVVFGRPEGLLVDRVRASGMVFEPAPLRPRVRPSPAAMKALVDVVTRHRSELVHGWEWPPILEAYAGPFLRLGTVPVGTVMSMGVAPFIPSDVPLTVGTEQIAQAERRRRPVVHTLEPPVDLELNRPDPSLPDARAEVGAGPEDLLVVVVSRLAEQLKKEGLVNAIDAVSALPAELRVRLVIVGDGPARAELDALAASANTRCGRTVATLVGAADDPRPWYAAADVVLGMGSSALRAMAYAKPLVVQGERGFWQLLDADSLSVFLHQGWYGVGAGDDGAARLGAVLRELAAQPRRREELGRFASSVVRERFGLEHLTDRLEGIYADALEHRPRRTSALRHGARPAGQLLVHETRRRIARLRHRAVTEDFNAISAQSGHPTSRSTHV